MRSASTEKCNTPISPMQNESKTPRILLAGVPFGCDNVGDEAILATIIQIVRSIVPEAAITVSTRDHTHTPKKLNVVTCPLYGFDQLKEGEPKLEEVLKNIDFVIWPGATGLSDYPDLPLNIMETAQSMSIPTMMFCTGMNDQFNPFLYQLMPGKRKQIYSLVKALTFGVVDMERQYQTSREQATCERIRKVMPAMKAVIVRDPESLEVLKNRLSPLSIPIELGADSALTTEMWPLDQIKLSDQCRSWLDDASVKKIGLCISAQSPVTNLQELATAMDQLIEERQCVIVGLPMNPITDAELLEKIKKLMKNPDKLEIAYNCPEPEEITSIASKMDVVISSRLHLLILSTISCVPVIGISRGSKVTNFTNPLGIRDVGSVHSLNVEALKAETIRLLDGKSEYQPMAEAVLKGMLERLDHAKSVLEKTLKATFPNLS